MKFIKCKYGHHYNQEVYQECPYCRQIEEMEGNQGDFVLSEEAAAQVPDEDNTRTMLLLDENRLEGNGEWYRKEQNFAEHLNRSWQERQNQQKQEAAAEKVPVTGWLVYLNGAKKGRSVSLGEGDNCICLTDEGMAVLDDRTSRRNMALAILTYKSETRKFYLKPGSLRSLFYANDEAVFEMVELSKHTLLEMGRSQLLFVPCCGEEFGW